MDIIKFSRRYFYDSGSAKIYRDQEGVAILPSNRTFYRSFLPASTLKSASGIIRSNGRAFREVYNRVASPTHQSARLFSRTIPAGRPTSTESTVTHGPNHQSSWFSA